ncbi:MAG: cytochrome c-type biogenesis protein CcmH [Armatimonadota bacterium]|nr:cytochrome c-type biogenesis protein CcmH [Armatimonadota bacterium]
MVRAVIAVALAASMVFVAAVGNGATAHAGPTLEDQVDAIARELMCPVCAGQTVADSGSQLAEQMRAEIRKRLEAGQTREEIIGYFIGQFGEGVLAKPPARGTGLILWLSLPLALLVGALILRRFLKSNLAAARAPTAGPPPPTREEAERIAQALRNLDDGR